MRTKLLAAASVLTLALTSSAFAADIAPRPYIPPPPAPVWNWTTFYIGAHIGGAFTDSSGATFINSPAPLPGIWNVGGQNAFLGGGQLGFNYQFAPNWVIGIEGDISGTSLDRAFGVGLLTFSERIDWLASVTGRLGYTWGPGLLYAKGGVGFRDAGNYDLAFAGVAQPFTVDRSTTGWTVGGGLEYMFAPNWSAKAEYQYYNFDNTTFTNAALFAPATAIDYRHDYHTVKIGVNYQIPLTSRSSSVIARY